MKLGDIVICEFPFTNLVQTKIRPAVIVTTTEDYHNDVVVCLIASTIPSQISPREIVIEPTLENNLTTTSLIKVSRLATVHQSLIISRIGKLSEQELKQFVEAFGLLVQPV